MDCQLKASLWPLQLVTLLVHVAQPRRGVEMVLCMPVRPRLDDEANLASIQPDSLHQSRQFHSLTRRSEEAPL